MKRKLLLFVGLLAVLTSARAADAGAIVSISNVRNIVQGYGGSFDVVLNATNANLYTTLGLDVQLPEGFTYTGYTAGSLLTASHASHISTSDQGSNTRRFGSYADPTADFTATQGVLLTIHFNVSPAATSGTAYIRNASFSLGSVSYYATDASAELTVSNTVTLSDGESCTPVALSGVNVTVNRALKADVWNTICLPFAMTAEQISSAFGTGTDVAGFTGADYVFEGPDATSISVKFSPVTSMAANTPYIIKVPAAVSSFTVTGVNMETSANNLTTSVSNAYSSQDKFVGTYVSSMSIPDKYLYISDNQFKYSGGSATLKCFRAYFNLAYVLAGYNTASARAITFDVDGTTGIHVRQCQADEASGAAYSLNGQRMPHPSKGVIIQNNKKIIIK